MTRRTRRIILAGAILFFIFTTPTILLYAYGYSFDWQKKKPVLTGGLYLKSIPKKAEIYLDNKLKNETPALIKRLVPKNYQIRITKEGFHPWQKKLKIESQLVTEAKNILLIPVDPEIEIVDEKLSIDFSFKEFLDQEQSNAIFYIQEPSYILYKTDQTGSFQEQISLNPLPNNQDYEIFLSPNERIAALSDNNELYLLNPETRVFELISRDVQGIEFSKDNKKLLYFTPSEIWVYYLENIFSQPIKKAADQEFITRLSQRIKQAIWYDNNKTSEHIIFSVNHQIKIIELDDRDQRNIIDIIEQEAEQMAYHQKDKKLYFIKEDKLLSISLE